MKSPSQSRSKQTEAVTSVTTAVEESQPLPVYDVISDTEEHQFSLSHPKNYLGVPFGIAVEDPVEIVVPKKLVQMAGEAAYGAEALGLITRDKELTEAGEAFVAAFTETDDPQDVLDQFANTTHSRLISEVQADKQKLIRETIARYPPAAAAIEILSTELPMTLAELTEYALTNEHTLLADYLTTNETDRKSDLSNINAYKSTATYQFKSILFHAGILTQPGSDTNSLSPTNDIWALSLDLDLDVLDATQAESHGGEW